MRGLEVPVVVSIILRITDSRGAECLVCAQANHKAGPAGVTTREWVACDGVSTRSAYQGAFRACCLIL
eukprot:scaffold51747_cov19-Prasinocladus_malaysianus.AAC.1